MRTNAGKNAEAGQRLIRNGRKQARNLKVVGANPPRNQQKLPINHELGTPREGDCQRLGEPYLNAISTFWAQRSFELFQLPHRLRVVDGKPSALPVAQPAIKAQPVAQLFRLKRSNPIATAQVDRPGRHRTATPAVTARPSRQERRHSQPGTEAEPDLNFAQQSQDDSGAFREAAAVMVNETVFQVRHSPLPRSCGPEQHLRRAVAGRHPVARAAGVAFPAKAGLIPLTENFSMGYPENIRAANRRYRERRERTHPLLRAIRDAATTTAITLAALAFWAVMLAPIILPLFQ